jgi:putative ABC transport system ATP-binding protein
MPASPPSVTSRSTTPIPPTGPVADPILRTESLVKVFGSGDTAVRALDGVDLRFGTGSFTAIMGPSGSGKSTLMHCAAGLDTPTSGRVLLGSTDLTGLADRQLTTIRRDRIGFVFQSFNLLPTLTARQNILLPLDLAGTAPTAEHFFALCDALRITDRLDHRPAQLSGGQQQRVAIARALITRPDVVFADEPTGALDSRSGVRLLEFLRAGARELGQTIVMVTHDPIAAGYADRVVLLADGRVAGELAAPTPDDVLAAIRPLGVL